MKPNCGFTFEIQSFKRQNRKRISHFYVRLLSACYHSFSFVLNIHLKNNCGIQYGMHGNDMWTWHHIISEN